MDKLNIAEILQKAPRNMEVTLYSPLLGKCTLNGINQHLIWVTAKDGLNYSFQHDGTYFRHIGDCLLYPDDTLTWEHWQEVIFKKGCFVKDVTTAEVFFYAGDSCIQNSMGDILQNVCLDGYCFANGSEISSFLNKLLDNGFKYNKDEERIEPFNVDIAQTESVVFNVEKQVHEYRLTQKQFELIKVVLDHIKKKKL